MSEHFPTLVIAVAMARALWHASTIRAAAGFAIGRIRIGMTPDRRDASQPCNERRIERNTNDEYLPWFPISVIKQSEQQDS